MYNGSKALAFIPARGGSKGIPGKNIAILAGKPLICYTVEAALGSRYTDFVFVSTDSEDIADVARGCGAEVPFLRPSYLAGDDSKTIDAVLFSISELKKSGLEFDVLILLQPTSPLRTARDIDLALESFFENGQQAMASVSPVRNNPVLIRSLSPAGRLFPLLAESSSVRRQDMREYYFVNGAIYINPVGGLNAGASFNDNPLAYVMPPERSVDIDDARDLWLAERLLDGSKQKPRM